MSHSLVQICGDFLIQKQLEKALHTFLELHNISAEAGGGESYGHVLHGGLACETVAAEGKIFPLRGQAAFCFECNLEMLRVKPRFATLRT